MIKQVDIEGEPYPIMMYKPYVYSNIVDCSSHYTIFCPNKEVKVIKKKNKEYGKEIDVALRDPNRIEPFLQDLGAIWKNCAPDYRFGQLIENVFGEMDYVPFMLEENRMLEEFEKYFKLTPEQKKEIYKHRRKTNGTKSKSKSNN